MRGHFKTFTTNVRPTTGNIIPLLLLVLVLFPILLIVAILAVVFLLIRLVFKAIFAFISPAPVFVPQPFDDQQGRRNVRVRHIENLAATVDAPRSKEPGET